MNFRHNQIDHLLNPRHCKTCNALTEPNPWKRSRATLVNQINQATQSCVLSSASIGVGLPGEIRGGGSETWVQLTRIGYTQLTVGVELSSDRRGATCCVTHTCSPIPSKCLALLKSRSHKPIIIVKTTDYFIIWFLRHWICLLIKHNCAFFISGKMLFEWRTPPSTPTHLLHVSHKKCWTRTQSNSKISFSKDCSLGSFSPLKQLALSKPLIKPERK